jgi:hypothetical protein
MYCLFFVILLFVGIFYKINSEIEDNVKHGKYEKVIHYNECGIPIDTIITLKK